jgi:hypothetical protein
LEGNDILQEFVKRGMMSGRNLFRGYETSRASLDPTESCQKALRVSSLFAGTFLKRCLHLKTTLPKDQKMLKESASSMFFLFHWVSEHVKQLSNLNISQNSK